MWLARRTGDRRQNAASTCLISRARSNALYQIFRFGEENSLISRSRSKFVPATSYWGWVVNSWPANRARPVRCSLPSCTPISFWLRANRQENFENSTAIQRSGAILRCWCLTKSRRKKFCARLENRASRFWKASSCSICLAAAKSGRDESRSHIDLHIETEVAH